MTFNLFDFATSELSHSAFYAWLIQQVHPEANGFDREVRETGRELINQMLSLSEASTISDLNEIEKCVVKTERSKNRCRFDIVVFLRLNSGRNIGIIVENKLSSNESRPDQLKTYLEEGEKLIKLEFNVEEPEQHFIYLKADWDYGYTLEGIQNSEGPPQRRFRMINWQTINKIFGERKYSDSILKSYSEWISNKHKSISSKLAIENLLSPQIDENLLNDHISQTTIFRHMFPKLLRKPQSFEKDKDGYTRYHYDEWGNIFMKLGNEKNGTPWSQLWGWDLGNMDLFYRIQLRPHNGKLEPRLEVKVYSRKEKKDHEVVARVEKLKSQYHNLTAESDLAPMLIPKRSAKGQWELLVTSFRLNGFDIEKLPQIENIHNEFVKLGMRI